MNEDLLSKWLNNELSKQELLDFKQSEDYAAYAKIVETTSLLQGPIYNQDHAFSKLQSKIKAKKKTIKLRPSQIMMRVAAVLIIAFGAFFYFNSTTDSISTNKTEIAKVVLPDQSLVTLNAQSKIDYKTTNWDRNISLEGEAFFKVAKGKTFTVLTKQGKVQVLGTQFNVKQRKGIFEVHCYEGSVKVVYNKQTSILAAGDLFSVLEDKPIVNGKTTKPSPTWLENESSFTNMPLHQVFSELERQYHINIDYSGVKKTDTFSGSFIHSDLNLALQSICSPFNLEYNLSNAEVKIYAKNTP